MKTNLPEVNYSQEMQIIIEQYGSSKFNGRVMNLIYDGVKTLKIDQFKKVIDQILMEGGYAPKPKDFIKHAEPYIRLNYDNEKQEETKNYNSMFTSEQLVTLSKGMQKVLNGDDKMLSKIIDGLKPLSKAKCSHCEDSGYVYAISLNPKIDGYSDKTYNCFCRESNNDPRFLVWGSRYNDILINKNKRSAA